MNSPEPDRLGRNRSHASVDRLAALTASLFAFAATLIATAQGPGLNPDSANYLSAGRSLAEGTGLVTFGGGTMTIFPPGLSAVIAAGIGLGAGADLTVRLLNATAFGTTVWLTFVLLRRHVSWRWLVLGGTALTAVSSPLLTMAEMVWTEPTFIVVCLAFVLALEEALHAERRWPWVAAAVALTWTAFLFRYAGVSLVAAGAVALLIGLASTRSWRVGLSWSAGFGAAASVVPLMWMARNHGVDGTFMGPRSPSVDEPIGTLARFVATLGRWVLPSPVPVALQAAMGVVVLVLGAVVATLLRRQPRTAPAGGTGARSLIPLTTFVVVYSAYLITAQLTTAFDQIGNRLMSPLVAPCTVLLFVALDRGVQLVEAGHPTVPVRRLLGVVVALLVVGHGVVVAQHVVTSARDAVGYRQRSWSESDVMEAVRELPASASFYTNAPGGLWAATGRTPVWPSPAQRVRRSQERLPMAQQFLQEVSCGDAYLVWFDEIPGGFLYSPDELADVVELTPLHHGAAGSLYRLSPQGSSTAQCGG